MEESKLKVPYVFICEKCFPEIKADSLNLYPYIHDWKRVLVDFINQSVNDISIFIVKYSVHKNCVFFLVYEICDKYVKWYII
jgi:hypothetical protein